MTADEAIRDLQARVDGEFSVKGVDDCADMKLGVEALKQIQELRSWSWYWREKLLPGETEE